MNGYKKGKATIESEPLPVKRAEKKYKILSQYGIAAELWKPEIRTVH